MNQKLSRTIPFRSELSNSDDDLPAHPDDFSIPLAAHELIRLQDFLSLPSYTDPFRNSSSRESDYRWLVRVALGLAPGVDPTTRLLARWLLRLSALFPEQQNRTLGGLPRP